MRAIGVSHTACKDEFDEIFDLTAGVYFNFYNILLCCGGTVPVSLHPSKLPTSTRLLKNAILRVYIAAHWN